jgi:hypothetical protein
MSTIHANFTDGSFTVTDDAAHSEALELAEGDFTLAGLLPDGRASDEGESRGHLTGIRKGARAYPTVTVTAKLSSPARPFNMLAIGATAGFTSTSVGIGDYATVDAVFSFAYGAETRKYTMDDLKLTDFTVTEGSPYSTVAFSFEVKGPMTTTGPEGTFTLISAR